VVLPERRVELYQKYVETLLKHWNLARGLDRPPSRDLDVIETVRVLAPLALWMHETSPGVGLVKREDVQRKLEEIYAGREMPGPERAARQLLADVREHAGLLLERVPGEYGFIHLTFQEYLAAVAIALRGQREVGPVVEVLAAHVGDDNWREVTLLAVGYLGIVQQRDEAAGVVLQALIRAAPGEAGQAAVLAGQAAIDACPGGVTAAGRAAVVRALRETMAGGARVKAALRAAAGDALARLGDPCPEATTLEGMAFCYIPPGPFRMGEGDEAHLNETLDKGYRIARYPVTVAQFRAFVEAGGYAEPRYWPEARAAGMWQAGKVKGFWEDEPRNGPYDFGTPFNLDNHPVVGVTWYEALAFCRWLSEAWQTAGWIGPVERVRLPSEAEWEKAARGGVEIPASPVVACAGAAAATFSYSRANPHPMRRYPWGDDPDPDRANYDDTGIGGTSAVGCFPGGASPYGCLDMSGNVWEWCCSLYASYPYRRDDGREDLKAEGSRVLRGGSFRNNGWLVRCASRRWNRSENWFGYYGFRLVVAPGFASGL